MKDNTILRAFTFFNICLTQRAVGVSRIIILTCSKKQSRPKIIR